MEKELQQYIDFYKSGSSIIDDHSAPVLNVPRAEAVAFLEHCRLPRRGDENYHVTDLPALLAPDYGINIKRAGMPMDAAAAFRCDVPNLNALVYYQCNDEFRAPDKDYSSVLPAGVFIGSLRQAAVSHRDIIEKYYNTIAPHSDAMVALNTLFAQDGVVVYIPRNTTLSRPVQVVNILSGAAPVLVSRRMLVIAEDNAGVKLVLCDHSQNPDVASLVNQVVEVYAAPGSRVEIFDMEESSAATRRVSGIYVRQSRDSQFLSNSITLVNGATRNNISVDVAEPGCATHLYGICIGRDNEIIDNNTFIAHNAPLCHSREQYKYLLEGTSRGCFGGKIYVAPGADKVEAYQSNNNIIASDDAKIFTKPQLEIYTDDVKCSHGATTGQLDEKALFYMRSRGIPADKARQLLMQAFMDEVIDTVSIDILRDRLKHLVEKRLSGELALCSSCAARCPKK